MNDIIKYLARRVKDEKEFRIGYINPKGNFADLRVRAKLLWFGKHTEHPNDIWILTATNLDEEEEIWLDYEVYQIGIKDEELSK